MTPFEVLTIGHKVWEIGNEIYEKYNDSKPQEGNNFRDSSNSEPIPRWKYFKKKEFCCPCCGENRISENLLDRLDFARGLTNLPMRVASGYRCKRHNTAVGGKPRSAHIHGLAGDIICPSGSLKATMVASFFESGIRRIGIYKNFIHVDISENLPSPMLWVS